MSILNLRDQAVADKAQAAQTEQRGGAASRRSSRVVINIPVTLFGQNSSRRIFEEQTRTITVSAHGALLLIKSDIDSQKPVLIANPKTEMQVPCRVAYRKENREGEIELGIEFAEPLPKFWGIHFPPDDWNPAERKKPSSPQRPLPNFGKVPREQK